MFIDTSFCIDLMREYAKKERGTAVRKLESLGDTPLYMSLFVACELQAGVRMASRSGDELKKVERLMDLVELIVPDRTLAVAYGETEAAVRRKGRPIPTMDLLIGVMAKMHGMPLLAGRDNHFRDIPGLVVESY